MAQSSVKRKCGNKSLNESDRPARLSMNWDSESEAQYDCLQDSGDSSDSSTDDNTQEITFWDLPRHPVEPPHVHPFTGPPSGLKTNKLPHITQTSTPLEFFQILFRDDVVQLSVDETNRYYHQYCDSLEECPSPKRDVTVNEMRLFVAINLQMGHDVRDSLKDYWSTAEPFHTPFYGATMRRDRYFHILRFLHFTDNKSQLDISDRNYDRLWKIRNFFNKLNNSYKEYYNPSENLAVDEVSFKGRKACKQYIPRKRKPNDIQIYTLCDSLGYTYSMTVQLGKDRDQRTRTMTAAHATIARLTEQVQETGHKLYMNDVFSSPRLFDYLYDRKMNCCGTVRCNQNGLPQFGKKYFKLKKGEIRARVRDNLTLMSWKDKREVYILTNIHPPPVEGTFYDEYGNALKPEIVLDYNTRMDYVDLKDRLTNTYTTHRRTWKWPTKLFYHLLDLTVLNSYFLYTSFKDEAITYKNFRTKLIAQLVRTSVTERHRPRVGRPSPAAPSLLRLDSQTNEHWPMQNEKKKRCRVCSARNKQQRTRFACEKCEVGLCLDPCFKLYHTKLHL